MHDFILNFAEKIFLYVPIVITKHLFQTLPSNGTLFIIYIKKVLHGKLLSASAESIDVI